jgi:outer membrane protein TolC
MRWKIVIAGLLVTLAATFGCKQPLFLTESDVDFAQGHMLPARVATDPKAAYEPEPGTLEKAPSNVSKPERNVRFITLGECIATALEGGTIGSTNPSSPGIPNDTLVTFGGTFVSGSDAIRVLALDPAIIGAGIESALSKFDTRFDSSLNWNTTDRPVGTALDRFQAGALTSIRTEAAEYKASLLKPLPTGGVAGITFDTPYQFTNLPATVNPSYTPSVQFQFEQPLLQGFGEEINQLRSTHPGSILTPFPTNVHAAEGILITRIRYDQERAEFERNVHSMLLNVEAAYWNLYSAYYTLYARELGLQMSLRVWAVLKRRLAAGAGQAETAEPQFRGQYELFRSQRLTALGQVLESERRLRRIMGINIEDGTRLVPADVPTVAPYPANWDTAVQETISQRPELVLARQDLKFRQLDLINNKNLLLPDLRSFFTYNANSIGSRLDGPDAHNAFRNLASDHFNSWTAGLQLDVPIGFRDANAAVRIARLNLARSYRTVREQEQRAVGALALFYRQLDEFQTQIAIQRSQRDAYSEELRVRFQVIAGGAGIFDVNLQTAISNYSNALANEYGFIGQYNTAIAQYEFSKGSIMQHDNVQIAEGSLEGCAAVRAVDHEKERSKAIILRERANAVDYTPENAENGCGGMPVLPKDGAPSIPALIEKAPPLPPEALAVPSGPKLPEPDKTPDRPSAGTGSRIGNNLPYSQTGTGLLPVGLKMPVPLLGTKSTSGATLSGPDPDPVTKGMLPGVQVDTGWTPRP